MNFVYYNGIPMLDINAVWDKEAYPFAVIETFYYANGDALHELRLFASNAYYFISSYVPGQLYFGGSDGGEQVAGVAYQYTKAQSSWLKKSELSNSNMHVYSGEGEWSKGICRLTWANFDIEYDGTLYLAASDPVPVHHRNPSAMLMGFQVGQAIRRMRK